MYERRPSPARPADVARLHDRGGCAICLTGSISFKSEAGRQVPNMYGADFP
jgi:hypothetical protein